MHRLLVIGATSFVALALAGPAVAWSWPADGDVLRPFALGGDAYAAGQHRGIDVAGPAGSPIRAPASGTVSFAGSLPTYGRSLTILTADGYAVTLVHLGAVEVAKGDAVEEGSPVATMGSSGEPEHPVPSVHLGVRVASQEEGYVDPLGLLPPRASAPRPEAPAPLSPVSATPPVPSAAAASPGAAAGPSPAPTPAAAAPVASASGAPSPPVAAPQAAGDSQTGSPSSASSASPASVSVSSEPVASASASPSSATDASPPTAAQAPSTSTVEGTAEFVVSTPVRRVPPAVVVRRASQTTGAVAHAGRPAVGASTARDVVFDGGVGADRRVPLAEAGVEPVVSENATAPATARPRPQVAAVSRGRGRRAHVTETAPAGGGASAERAATGEPSERATRVNVLLPATTPERAGSISEPGLAGERSRAVLAAVALLALLAAGIAMKAVRRIAGDEPVLRHHTDLLRELHAAHRARVHDRGSRRLHAPSTAARS